ncbi:MAG: hypothetical protein QM831_02670 [Kofleriaceae bacterium]
MSEEEQRLALANDKLNLRLKQLSELESAERARKLIEPAPPVVDDEDPNLRIARARESLTEKLDELRRREAKVRATVAPVRHLANPWVQLGIALAAGLFFGSRSREA